MGCLGAGVDFIRGNGKVEVKDSIHVAAASEREKIFGVKLKHR